MAFAHGPPGRCAQWSADHRLRTASRRTLAMVEGKSKFRKCCCEIYRWWLCRM